MPIEDFTYSAYDSLINLINKNGYRFTNYHNSADDGKKQCIIRHDVDSRLEKTVRLGEIEYNNDLSSTYFVLLRTDMYNVFSKRCVEFFNRLQSLGHEIGLHFDEGFFAEKDYDIKREIKNEAAILSEAIGQEVRVVSMHRPSEKTLGADYQFDNIVNSNSKKFFKEFKYLSDSRMFWRENVEDAVCSEKYRKIHLSLHPGWYSEEKNTMAGNLRGFIDSAKDERYKFLSENIYDLETILCRGNER